MLRLSAFCMLLAVVAAQSGYEYNKPGKPFGPGSTSSRPNYPSGPSSGYQSTTPYPGRPQTDDYSSSTPGYPSGSLDYSSGLNQGYPTGPSQSYPGSSGLRPQPGYRGQGSSSGFPGSSPSYPGKGPTFSSQGPNGLASNIPGNTGPSYPGQGGRRPSVSGQAVSNYPGQNYPAQSGFGPGGPGFDGSNSGAYENGDYSAIPGTPEVDYPILSEIPRTSFDCKGQPYPGYYADVETRCQVFHVCANNRTYDFLCPNGTIFSQQDFVCVWWNQFDCNSAPSLYEINANIYDYSSTGPGSGADFGLSGLNDYTQGQQPSYPGSGQGPPYPGSSKPQGPSLNYPGSGAQGSSYNYPSTSGTRGPSSNYPGSSGPSTPYASTSRPSYPASTSYPSSQGLPGYSSSGFSTPYPGSSGPQGPSYPGSPDSSTSRYPGTTPGYPTSETSNFPGNQGYPSGRPTGPNFPGGNGRPVQPNREYLPPRN